MSRLGWTSRSSTSPSLSTARHRYMRLPWIETTISSRCHVPVGSGSQPAQVAGERGPELQDPAPDGLVGGLDAALGQEFLHIAVAEREPEIEMP